MIDVRASSVEDPRMRAHSPRKAPVSSALLPTFLQRRAPRLPPFLSRRRAWIAPVLLVLASLIVGIVHVPQHDRISPIDEFVYIDYLAKVPQQGLVRHGEETGWFARNYYSCHGVVQQGDPLRYFCDRSEHAFDKHYPIEGFTSADIYTPFYFIATWTLAQPLTWVGVDLVSAGRFVGALWLACAAVLLFLTMRRMRIPDPVGFAVTLLMVGSVQAYWANTYIGTDSTSLAAGALLLYLAVNYGSRSNIGWGLVIASATVALIKFQNIAAVGVAALFMLCIVGESFWERRREKGLIRSILMDRRLLTAAMMLALPVFLQAAWLVVRNALDLGVGGSNGEPMPLTLGAIFRETFKFFGEASYDPSITPMGAGTIAVSHIVAWLTVTGVLGVILVAKNRSRIRAIALAALASVLLLGPALAFVATFTGSYFALPPRYAIPLLPIMLLCTAWLASTKRHVSMLIIVIGVFSFLLSLTI